MALAIDGSTPALATNAVAATATVTTASFTPPAGALLLVLWSGNSALGASPGSPTVTDNLGAHLTYTLLDWQSRASAPTKDGQAAIWSAVVGSSAAMTVTVTNAAASGSREAALRVVVITGQHATPIGTHSKTGSTGASSIAQGFTGTSTSSWGFLVDCDWDLKGTQTAGTGCTLLSAGSVGSAISYGFVRRTTADGTNGGTTTMNVTLPGSSTNLGWCWAEVVPATSASLTADVTVTETVGLTVDATVTSPARPPTAAGFTAAAVTAARARGGCGQAILIRTPASGVASTADVALTEAVTITAAASRGQAADLAATEVATITADASRGQPAAVTLTSTATVTATASVTSSDVPQPVVFDFTDAAARRATQIGTPARAVLMRSPAAGTASTADVALTEAVTITAAAGRGQASDVAAVETVTVTASATVTSSADVPQAGALDFTQAAVQTAARLTGQPNRVSLTRTPAAAATSQTADVAATSTVTLTATATLTGAAAAQPAVHDFTQAAATAAGWYYGRTVDAVIVNVPAEETTSSTADVALTEAVTVTAAATRGQSAAVALAETVTTTASGVRGQTGDSTVTVTVTVSTAATVTNAGAAAVFVTETVGFTTAATRAQTGAVALAEAVTVTAAATAGAAAAATPAVTVTVTASATTGTPAAVTTIEVVTITATASATAEPTKATSTALVTAHRGSVDAVEDRRTALSTIA